MSKVTVNRKAHFNAAHRLHNPKWDSEKNKNIFGKCNNDEYHGHNYDLIVSVTGNIDEETGYVADMKWLKDLIKNKIEDRFDHKNLNTQTQEFKNLNPTAENMAVVIYNLLKEDLNDDFELKITLYETARNYVEYSG
jgi:6-pyruvoyltetrahydropterin/6-carboxytetrahydropterin synthase